MNQWQKDAIKLFREARKWASQTGNASLHRACARAIDALAESGQCVPLELRRYAIETHELYGRPKVLRCRVPHDCAVI